MLRNPKTGTVILKTQKGILVDHLDQRVKNTGEKECVISYFNTINEKNELESTEVQSCNEPISVSNIRTLKVKFEPKRIQYVLIAKDPIKNSENKIVCDLEKVN